MKSLPKTLILSVITLSLSLGLFQIAAAKITPDLVCTFLNNQNASATKSAEPSSPNQYADFDDKMVVITEEKMGAADNNVTFDCYRIIEDSSASGASTTPATTSDSTPPATPPATTSTVPSVTPGPKQTFKVTYASSCSTQAGTTCEPVRVYVTTASTDLLYYYIGQLYRYAAGIGGLLAVLLIILAGIMRITAGDNTSQITTSTGMITKSLTGLVVLFTSAIILYLINPNFFTLG